MCGQSGATYVRRITIQCKNVGLMGRIKQTFTQYTIHRWSTRALTKVMEMVTEVEAQEAIKVMDKEDEETLTKEEVEGGIIS